MVGITYLDFDLLVEGTEERYTARVLDSPAGQATCELGSLFPKSELEDFVARIGRARRGVRRLESPEMEAAKAFGGRLYDSVFRGEVHGCFRSSLDEARRQGVGLRIRLRLDAPGLTDVPWEYLYHLSLNRFLSLSTETPVVRYLELPERIPPLALELPLRVLVVISSPRDYHSLDVEREWQKLREAVVDLEQRGILVLERLEDATLTALQRRLRRGDYHIFHFIGHGAFDEQAQDGVLLLEDEQGWGQAVSGQYLGMLLHDERTLQLAILNACEGARTSATDPFAGSAQSLVQQGIPAVIAMQFEITDRAASILAHEFYAAMADGYPVDAALAEARKAIFAQSNDVEWGTPVLYMRAPDGEIFDVSAPSLLPEKTENEAQPARWYATLQPLAERLPGSLPASASFVALMAIGYLIGWVVTYLVASSEIVTFFFQVVEYFGIDYPLYYPLAFGFSGAVSGALGGLAFRLALRWIEPPGDRKEPRLFVISWALGGAISAVVAEAVAGPYAGEWVVGGVIGWSVGGLIIGLTLWRTIPSIRWKQMLVLVAGWILAELVIGVLAQPEGALSTPYRAIHGLCGGLAVGLAWRWAEPAIPWKWVWIVVAGWFVGGAVGSVVSGLGGYVGSDLLTYFGLIISGFCGGWVTARYVLEVPPPDEGRGEHANTRVA